MAVMVRRLDKVRFEMSDGEGAHITGAIPICWRRALEAEKIEKHFRFGRLWRRRPHNWSDNNLDGEG